MRQCPLCERRYLDPEMRTCSVDGSVLQEVVLAGAKDALVGVVVAKRFTIEKVLGDGGMGVVYGGVDSAGRKVAIKVLRAEYSDDEDLVRRFQTEAEAVAKARHPNVVEIYEFGVMPDGSRFFVMEFLDGKSLNALLKAQGDSAVAPGRRVPLPEGLAVHVASQIGAALAAAHAAGVVHRDLKPDNIQLLRRGEDEYFVKVLDFGIAKVHNARHAKTRTGSVFGTPHYMSPEQANGETNIDGRSDVYSLGALLYEMVTGQVPFDADNLMGILMAHMHQAPVPPTQLPGTRVSPGLESVVLRALAKSREERYPTMTAFVADLRAVAEGQVPVAAGMPPPRLPHDSMRPASPELSGAYAQVPGASTAPVVGPRQGGQRNVLQHPVVLGLWGVALLSFLLAGVVAATRRPSPSRVTVLPPVAPPPLAAPVLAAPPPVAVPMVQLASDPPGASVFLERRLLGRTPLAVERPALGAVRVYQLELAGRVRTSITVRADTPDALQVMLPATQVAPAPPAPPAVPGTAGRRPPGPPPARGHELMDPWNTPPH